FSRVGFARNSGAQRRTVRGSTRSYGIRAILRRGIADTSLIDGLVSMLDRRSHPNCRQVSAEEPDHWIDKQADTNENNNGLIQQYLSKAPASPSLPAAARCI